MTNIIASTILSPRCCPYWCFGPCHLTSHLSQISMRIVTTIRRVPQVKCCPLEYTQLSTAPFSGGKWELPVFTNRECVHAGH